MAIVSSSNIFHFGCVISPQYLKADILVDFLMQSFRNNFNFLVLIFFFPKAFQGRRNIKPTILPDL